MVRKANSYLEENPESGFVLKVAINTGEVVIEENDIYGEAVNIAAVLQSNGLTLTAQVFQKLDSSTRQLFKKHTPPITYIPVEEAHADR